MEVAKRRQPPRPPVTLATIRDISRRFVTFPLRLRFPAPPLDSFPQRFWPRASKFPAPPECLHAPARMKKAEPKLAPNDIFASSTTRERKARVKGTNVLRVLCALGGRRIPPASGGAEGHVSRGRGLAATAVPRVDGDRTRPRKAAKLLAFASEMIRSAPDHRGLRSTLEHAEPVVADHDRLLRARNGQGEGGRSRRARRLRRRLWPGPASPSASRRISSGPDPPPPASRRLDGDDVSAKPRGEASGR